MTECSTRGHPWFSFFPRDWMGDPGLRAVSHSARGLWIDVLCLCYAAGDRGRLTVGGKPMTPQQLARATGGELHAVESLLDELKDAGVCGMDPDGAVYSRRMRRDMETRAKRAAGGHLGAVHGAKGAEHGIKGGRPKKATDQKTPSPPRGGVSKTPLKPPLHDPKGGYQSIPENKSGIDAGGEAERNQKPPKNPPYTDTDTETDTKTGTGPVEEKADGTGRGWKSGRGVAGFMPDHLRALAQGDPGPLVAQARTAAAEGTSGFRADYESEALVLAHGYDALQAGSPSPILLLSHRLKQLGSKNAITPSDESQARAKETLRKVSGDGLAGFAKNLMAGMTVDPADDEKALRVFGGGT